MTSLSAELADVVGQINALAPTSYVDYDGTRQELPPSDEGEWLFARFHHLENLCNLRTVTEGHSIEMIMGCCLEDEASIAERNEMCQHWEDEK